MQFKLQVGAVDDPAEREADAIADRVMRALKSPGPSTAQAQTTALAGRVQRSASSTTAESSPVPDDTSSRIRQLAGGGSALPSTQRARMERAFGTDLSAVRIHRSAESSRLNDELSAQAFTTGSDVFLGRTVNVDSDAGTRLLAHEVTHVLQQGGGTVRRSPLGGEVIRRWAGGGKKRVGLNRNRINESDHWNNPRDQQHRDGIAAIYEADHDCSISEKLYKKHNFTDTALITSFPTSRKGTYVVVGTFADVARGTITFDTAYLSKGPAKTGVPGKKYYNPTAPVIQL